MHQLLKIMIKIDKNTEISRSFGCLDKYKI